MIALLQLTQVRNDLVEEGSRSGFRHDVWLRADLIEAIRPLYPTTPRGDVVKGSEPIGSAVFFNGEKVIIAEKPDDVLARLGALVAHAAEVGR